MISIKKTFSVLFVVLFSIVLLSGCSNQNVPKEIQIPRVIGLSYAQAIKALEESGVKNISSNIDDYSMLDKEKLVVVDQNIVGNSMDDQSVVIQVNAKFTGNIQVDFIDDDDNPNENVNIRIVINGETVARLNNEKTVKWTDEYLESVIYLTFVDENNSTNSCSIGTPFNGDFDWNIHIKNNGQIEVTYQSVHEYITKQ